MAKSGFSKHLVPAAFLFAAVVGLVDFILDDSWSRWLGAVVFVTGLVVAVGLFRKVAGAGAAAPTTPQAPAKPTTPQADGNTIRTGGIRVKDLPLGLRRTDELPSQKPPPKKE